MVATEHSYWLALASVYLSVTLFCLSWESAKLVNIDNQVRGEMVSGREREKNRTLVHTFAKLLIML